MKKHSGDAMSVLGIDIGSTTVKVALVDPITAEVRYHRYIRHGAHQRATTVRLLEDLSRALPGQPVRPIFTGSGARTLAGSIDLPHVQEVVANSLAVRRFFPETRVAVELGGQDAKVIFFSRSPHTGELNASDMRMNGSCAGGTGAFIDEVAKLLQVPVEQFDDLAARGTRVYQISGRCGVFAKTDIQPLLNQGVRREDLALSTFHAVARQTIGGLAQGLEIVPPVIFQGGPLTFNHTLLKVFAERLDLEGEQVLRPDQPEIFVALGAALALPVIAPETSALDPGELAKLILQGGGTPASRGGSSGGGTYHGSEPSEGVVADSPQQFFTAPEEQRSFEERHMRVSRDRRTFAPGSEVTVYIGVDAGSTTTKVALIDEEGNLVDHAYSSNQGAPLRVAAEMLSTLLERYEGEGVAISIAGTGTTGYGERLFAAAFHADYHTVETVAHARAALHHVPGTSFILDIGGQDMKAISLVDGIVTGITLNEACSAGCGSFLENFASTLNVPVEEIAQRAFRSEEPSRLGSRCTVFMNSSIITEQKNGKGPDDILAGLCRSIVENVFTKVIRVPNFSALGEKVVVQGGTFENDAVLRSLEQYMERPVVRAPYPGLMGAIGVAMLTREHQQRTGALESTFRGLSMLEAFDYEQESGHICPFCTNSCDRTVIRFADGSHFITGNRCERGTVLEKSSREELRAISRRRSSIPNMMEVRERLLNRMPEVEVLRPPQGVTIGIPRVLEFWHSLPFWRTFWTSLGYTVEVSGRSTREVFEQGIASVPSDTVCFPAKLAHGHLLDLVDRKVDRIFMPMINRMPPENPSTCSDHVCAVVKGYPMVLEVSNEPERRFGIPLDKPLFHWVDQRTRRKQLLDWITGEWGVPRGTAERALDQADEVQEAFRREMHREGAEILRDLEGTDRFAVVLAGRPYHSDALINHDLASFFIQEGIPVLTIDSLPELDQVDLSRTRSELTVNFHVRMYAAALQVSAHPNLELVQMVSFGCGHDAIITDEVIRLMEKTSGKTPLSLKLDETDVQGPLAIRVRSFVETIRRRRESTGSGRDGHGGAHAIQQLPEPFPVKYTKADRQEKTILAPNVTRAFAHVISAVIGVEGYSIVPLPMADRRAIELGKRYIHNDMCFPAQVNVGETLRALESGYIEPDRAVCGLAKAQCDCRLAHYASLARKALDDAGYPQVPIITTDKDTKDMHPGFSLGPVFQLRMLWALGFVDTLESLRRRLRPYEVEPGSINRVFDAAVEDIAAGLQRSIRTARKAFIRAVDALGAVPLTDEPPRPQVFIIGEFLLNFHPTSNFDIEHYLEANGMEVVLPDILDSFRRDFMRMKTERREFHIRYPFLETAISGVTDALFDHVAATTARIAARNPRFTRRIPLPEVAQYSEEIVHHTFTSGEGWMIAGEILHHAAHGINAFLVLQPFGCLPNHVTGRGLVKRLKELHPEVQILSLDYDPDTSFANIENRLQMLVLNSKLASRDHQRYTEEHEKAERTGI